MNRTHKDPLAEGLKEHLPQSLLDYFASVRIGIIGCGGLGSHCAFMLARSGFRNFRLRDGDAGEPSNLNRQMFFPRHLGRPKAEALKELLRELSPDLDIQAENSFYDPASQPAHFADCDYLIEAVDRAEVKAAILNFCSPHNPWIASASGLGHWLDISSITTRTLRGKGQEGKKPSLIVLTGDGTHEICGANPPLMPGVVTAAAAQVRALIKQAVKESGYERN